MGALPPVRVSFLPISGVLFPLPPPPSGAAVHAGCQTRPKRAMPNMTLPVLDVVPFFQDVVCLIVSVIIKLFRLFLWWLFLPFGFPSWPFSPSCGLGLDVRGGPLSAFHLGLPRPHLYSRVLFILRQEV
jgi:hypothetical protein